MIVALMCQVLTFFIFALFAWSAVVSFKTFRLIQMAKSIHGKIRTSDKSIFGISTAICLLNALLIFVHPGLIFTLPGAVAMTEVGVGVLLTYLYERQSKNWEKFKATLLPKS